MNDATPELRVCRTSAAECRDAGCRCWCHYPDELQDRLTPQRIEIIPLEPKIRP